METKRKENVMTNIRTFAGSKPVIVCGLAALALLAAAPAGYCQATKYWQPAGNAAFTDDANWLPSGVPDELDTAAFTNDIPNNTQVTWARSVTNADIRFSLPTFENVPQLHVGSYTWYVTNQFLVAPNAANTSCVTLASGTLVITNSAGTASLIFGNGHWATLGLKGGSTCVVDRIVTAGSDEQGIVGYVGSVLYVLHGADWKTPNWPIPQHGAYWNFLGGTNKIDPGTSFWGMYDGAVTVVDGPATVLTNSGGLILSGSDCRLTVTNGAQFWQAAVSIQLSTATGDARNKIIVTGRNSLLSAGNIYLGNADNTSSNELTVADGGTVALSVNEAVNVGNIGGSSNNLLLVTGANSLLRGALYVGSNSSTKGSGSVRIENGGTLD
jgi:hypothetical protein